MQKIHWANKHGITLRHLLRHLSHQAALDSVTTSFAHNKRNMCKYPHCSQIFGGISTTQWRKAEGYRRFQ